MVITVLSPKHGYHGPLQRGRSGSVAWCAGGTDSHRIVPRTSASAARPNADDKSWAACAARRATGARGRPRRPKGREPLRNGPVEQHKRLGEADEGGRAGKQITTPMPRETAACKRGSSAASDVHQGARRDTARAQHYWANDWAARGSLGPNLKHPPTRWWDGCPDAPQPVVRWVDGKQNINNKSKALFNMYYIILYCITSCYITPCHTMLHYTTMYYMILD